MRSTLKTKDKAEATLTMGQNLKSGFYFKNPVIVECFDAEGNLKWVEKNYNLMTDEGLNDILDVYFSDGTQDTTHYVGLLTASTVAGDTLASGLDEFTNYTGNRQTWVEGGVSSKSISNTGNAASFSILGTGTITGAFLTNVDTGTAGVLICGVDFSAARSVANGDTLNVTYTLTIADA